MTLRQARKIERRFARHGHGPYTDGQVAAACHRATRRRHRDLVAEVASARCVSLAEACAILDAPVAVSERGVW